MQNAHQRAIGILAGGGKLPVEIAASMKARGARVEVVAFKGEAHAALDALSPTYVHWGQINRITNTLKSARCNALVIVGSVSRPDLTTLKPDLGFFKAIPIVYRIIRAGGDDAVLRGVIGFFEQKGISVVSPAEVAPELIVGPGPFCEAKVPADTLKDIALGFLAIRLMAPFDVGQSVVVSQGRLQGIEGVDGTDAMLNRTSTKRLSKATAEDHDGPSGVLVKRPKPGQELRIDLPVIGARTVMQCAEANLQGIAVEAGHVLAVEREDLKNYANGHGLFVEGVREENLPVIIEKRHLTTSGHRPMVIRTVGSQRLRAQMRKDIIKGAQLLEALDPLNQSFIAIVSRGHVLTLDNADERSDAIARSAGLHQWGDRRWKSRSGVVILQAGRDADEPTLRAVANTRLSCVAVRLTKFAATISPQMINQANALGLAVAEVFPGEGG